MPLNETKRNRIMELSFTKFTTMGPGHVTMDEIARGVGIGKGTLYKFFPSKEALLSETIDFIASHIENEINNIINAQNLNPVEKLKLLIQTVGKKLSKINPNTIAYLERNNPEAYDKIIEIRQRIIMKNLLKLLEEGKKSGCFNPEMDAYLVTNMLIGAANHVTNAKVLTTLNYSLDNLFNNIVTTLLQGCLTDDGRKLIL